MTITFQNHVFTARSIWFTCCSGQWAIAYTIEDLLTKQVIDKSYEFDRFSFTEQPEQIFAKLIELYKDAYKDGKGL